MTFLIISQNCAISFSDFFLYEVWILQYKHSKVTEPYFSRKMSFGQKRAQNGLKWTVSIISQNGLKVKVIFFPDILHEVKGAYCNSKLTDGINITQRGVK